MKLPSVSKKVLSIDFGSKEIKIVEGKYSKNNLQVLNAFEILVEPHYYNNGEIINKDILVALLKDGLKEKKVSTDLAYGIINGSDIITREITIPKVAEKEIAAIIEYQLEDFLPVNTDDYEVNHILLGSKTEGDVEKLELLLIGVPKDKVLSHLALMKEIGLKPEVLDYQGNAMAKLLKYNGLINESYNTRDIAIASIDIGYSSSKITIAKNGRMEVTRVIDVGMKDLYENLMAFFDYSHEEIDMKIKDIQDISIVKEEFSDYHRILNITKTTLTNLVDKIELIFRYYNARELGNNINLILLQGGTSNIKGIDKLFSNHFSIPAIRLKSLDKIKWSGDLNKYSNSIGGLIRVDGV